MQTNRRKFLTTAASLAAVALPGSIEARSQRTARPAISSERPGAIHPLSSIRFAVIGINHGHINSQVDAVIRGGGQFISFYAPEPELAAPFAKKYPQARQAKTEKEILEDASVQLVVSASIPADRGPLGVRVMKHGKDFMVDKPGVTSLDQLADVKKTQKETGRIFSVMYSERLENKATIKAGELVQAGAIGQVIQTIGLGPHRLNIKSRPEWFFDRLKYGGIICDIGAHQCDQFLYFTRSKKASVIASQVGNVHYPQHPGMEDFGDAMLRGDKGTGYIRVDWFTPDGLNTWGDGRLTILGTDGFIEIRKNVDIGGREGGSHLFLVDNKDTRYIDCSAVNLPYGEQLVNDVVNRTETAMSQEHCFLATEIALEAQKQAQRLVIGH